MPIEAITYQHRSTPYKTCPKCGEDFECFLRGMIVRFSWFGLRKKCFAVICRACKNIVGHE